MKIAEFLIQSEHDAKACSRRVRLLAGLADLTRRQRADLSRAFTEVCRAQLARQSDLRVEFGFAGSEGRQAVEMVIRSAGKQAPKNELEHLAELVDQFRLCSNDDGETVIRLGQQLPADAAVPSESELIEWGRVLQAQSTESALLDSQKRMHVSEAERAVAHGRSDDLERHLDLDASLRETLNMLSLVANKTDNLVMVLDTSGVAEWVNAALTKLAGYTFDEIVGTRPIDVLCGKATSAESRRALDDAVRLGHGASEEVQVYRKDGSPFWTSLTLTPITNERGHVERWIIVGADITRRRQAHDVLQEAKQTAEAASRAKSEFLANMSHEIRTPMNAIIGMTDLALGTELSTDQQAYLTTVKQSADALLELLNDILDLSKIEAGKLEIESIPFNLNELLTSTLSTLALRADVKGLELAWRLPPEVPSHLIGDPNRLRQIVINLVSNAIKFTEQGQVVVEVESQWQNDDEASLHFSVADTGIGILPDRLNRIFDAFEQADSSTTRRYGGTGLGLTICNQLIRLVGGKFWVQSQIGKGSTFHFSLRLKMSAESLAPYERADRRELVDKSVLVVDDNPTNRQILEERLISWRMRPSLAEDAGRAMKLLEAGAHSGRAFDLALIDAHMPDVDGFELGRQIQEHLELGACRVMMLTSRDQQRDAIRCRQLGIESYLVKPVSPSTLFDAMLTAFGRQSSARRVSPEKQEVAATSLKILVADDHQANRELAASILRKRGHQVSFAANGHEAFSTIEREAFDVVLMDVQMPEMDGFQATAAVRQREKETQTHVPIIALTAHAMKGDRDKCLVAGMDAYLPKPLDARELQTLVESLAAAADPAFVSMPVSTPSSEDQADFDLSAALDRLAGDQDILKQQMGFFLNDGPRLLDEIRSSIAAGEGKSLKIAAHRLKGLTASYDAHRAAKLAQQLETLGNEGTLDAAETIANELSSCVDDLRQAIEAYRLNA